MRRTLSLSEGPLSGRLLSFTVRLESGQKRTARARFLQGCLNTNQRQLLRNWNFPQTQKPMRYRSVRFESTGIKVPWPCFEPDIEEAELWASNVGADACRSLIARFGEHEPIT